MNRHIILVFQLHRHCVVSNDCPTEKKNSPHVNRKKKKKKLTCKRLVFCSEHVYEYEETDEERAKRRKMAVIEQDIRCFE